MKPGDWNLPASLVIMFITIMITSQSIVNTTIKPRLYDGTINELGRYSFTFDAYEYIEDDSDYAVIAIGSSKMREIFDGELFGQYSNSTWDFYNVAYAGEHPYVRMIEIEAIIATQPEMVVLEFGPNTLSFLPNPVSEATAGRMSQLMSLNTHWLEQSWEEMLTEGDAKTLPITRFEQVQYIANYTPEAIETTINYHFEIEEPPYSCDRETGNVRCVPSADSEEFDQYVQYPIQFRNSLERIKAGKSSITIEEFYGPRLDKYISRSYHNPEGVVNKNQLAYEFMIESLLDNQIEVVLVGLPYNPVLIDRLSDGQWDYYNQTRERYLQDENITVIDYVWTDFWVEEDFNDFTHASRLGEIKFAENLYPIIESVLCEEC